MIFAPFYLRRNESVIDSVPIVKMRRLSSFLFWMGSVLVFISALFFSLGYTAVPVVADVSLVAMTAAAIAIAALSGSLLVARRVRRGGYRRTAVLFLSCLALVLVALTAQERFLSYRLVEFPFRNGPIELAGSLFLPRTPGPWPAAVFVHGSGPESRHEYAYYAKLFARAGIAGLAYDKRGVGESTGELYGTDFGGYARDAAAAVGALARREDIDATSIGFIGFSEGEWVAPLAAVDCGKAAFIAVIGASGMSPAEQVNAEIALRLQARGYSDEVVAKALALNESVFDYQRTGEGGEELKERLGELHSEPWFRDAEDIPNEIFPMKEYRWWKSVMDFDPAPVWQRVLAPVLILKGGRDKHSPAGLARERIVSALHRGGNDSVEFMLFPEADHSLLEWPLGDRIPPPVFSDDCLNRLIHWVQAQTGVKN
ncbi:MAG: alpha/beta hydrolase [Acidobacteriota bacterium]